MTENGNHSSSSQFTLSYPQDGSHGYDLIFKIVVIGDANVGKTSVLQRFRFDTFSERHGATLGVDFTLKEVSIEGKRLKVSVGEQCMLYPGYVQGWRGVADKPHPSKSVYAADACA